MHLSWRRRHPYFEVKRGITRTVLLIGSRAIKFPSLRTHDGGLRGLLWSVARGVLANQSEWESRESKGVCPVTRSWFGGVVNVYPRCVPLTRHQEMALRARGYDSIGYAGPTDKKPTNVGILNHNIVWLDYDQNWNDGPPCQHVRR